MDSLKICRGQTCILLWRIAKQNLAMEKEIITQALSRKFSFIDLLMGSSTCDQLGLKWTFENNLQCRYPSFQYLESGPEEKITMSHPSTSSVYAIFFSNFSAVVKIFRFSKILHK